jgi:multisubunit Na+/H+ antiporter MnhF subunit
MIDFLLKGGILLLAISIVLALIRMARGPTVLDRILAFDLITTCAVGIIALLSMKWQTTDYIELILIYSLLGFSGATAFVFYLQRTYDPHDDRPDPDRSQGGHP